jgi:hypothetical protein
MPGTNRGRVVVLMVVVAVVNAAVSTSAATAETPGEAAASRSKPYSPPGPSRLELMEAIAAGRPFEVIFDRTTFDDDESYDGSGYDPVDDPLGALKAGERYQVVYRDGKFTCTGFDERRAQVTTETHGGADPREGLVSLWGRVFELGRGTIRDSKWGTVGHVSLPATASPENAASTADGRSNPPSTNPPSQAALIEAIAAGRPFEVVFDLARFDDSGYDPVNDPMGTLKAGERYQVAYRGGLFTCTGFSEREGQRSTFTYGGGDPRAGQISLWGRVYALAEQGTVLDPQFGVVGHVRVPGSLTVPAGRADARLARAAPAARPGETSGGHVSLRATASPENAASTADGRSNPPSTNPPSRAALIEAIAAGRSFEVVFDLARFDDSGYDPANDPMGTLKAGERYQLVYRGGLFTCTGFSESQGRTISRAYGGADPRAGQISLWGRVYALAEQGTVLDPQFGVVGHLRVTGPPTAPAGPAGAQRAQAAPAGLPHETPVRAAPADSLDEMLIRAAGQGKSAEARAALLAGASPNARSGRRCEPVLFSAVFGGDAQIVKLLLDKGADVMARDEFSSTPLHLAAGRGLWPIVEILIRKGAELEARDGLGHTPLDQAASSGRLEAARVLLENGAAVDARDTRGETALFKATQENHPEMVRLLLAHGAKWAEVALLERHLATLEQLRTDPHPESVTWIKLWGPRSQVSDRLPDELSRFPNLKKLEVGKQQLKSFSFDFSTVPKLESVTIEDCGLDAVPDSVRRIGNLKSLALPKNRIRTLPAWLAEIKTLQQLDLSANAIGSIEVDLASLPNLTTLRLKANGLTTVPRAIWRAPRIEELDLSENPFDSLPDEIRTFRNLRTLSLYRSRIDALPPALKECSKLRDLYIMDTPVAHDDEAMENLDEQLKKVIHRFWVM